MSPEVNIRLPGRIRPWLMILVMLTTAGCRNKHIPAYLDPDLPVDERVDHLISLLTLEEKAAFMTGDDMWHFKGVVRLGIPPVQVTDCGHGVTVVLDEEGHNTGCATCFPTAVGQASTWNRELVEEIGAAIGREARALGSSILLAPMVNIHRTPLGGRNYETYSEDPYLSGSLASSFISGVQSEHVGAVIKAVTANNQQANQGYHSVEVSERALREIYLPSFRIPVTESAPWGIMTSYNKVNGTYASANKHLISDIIKDEWRYRGFVVSDWRGTHDIEALYAGLDLEMPGPGKVLTKTAILEEIAGGRFTEAELDDRISRILSAIIRSKSLEHERGEVNSEWNTPHHHLLARRAAEESIVLLKNEHKLLPLSTDRIKTLAITGPNAREARLGGGGSASVTACYTVSPIEGIMQQCGETVQVLFEEGCGMKGDMPIIYSRYLRTRDGDQTVRGLKGEYFNGRELAGDPVLVRFDQKIDFSWGWAAPCPEVDRGDYSVRWTGQVIPPETGEYGIGVSSTEAGVRLYLDGVLVIDRWGDPYHDNFEAGFRKVSERIKTTMQAGVPREICLEFHKKANRNSIRLEWEIPGKEDPVSAAVSIARESDAAIIFAGLSNLYEGGTQDRERLSLPAQQNRLISAVARANPNTIVVLINGTPLTMPWINEVPAILEAYYPGQEGGHAMARILFGEVCPSGKLPETFPQRLEDNPSFGFYPGDRNRVVYGEGIYVGYRHYDKQDITPLFPFGHGLSYTTFGYDNLQIEKMADGSCRVQAEVTNTGTVSGKEIIQLYIGNPESDLDCPPKELKGFTKIGIDPGKSRTVSFELPAEYFAQFDSRVNQWLVEPGEYQIMLGSSSRDIRLRGSMTME